VRTVRTVRYGDAVRVLWRDDARLVRIARTARAWIARLAWFVYARTVLAVLPARIARPCFVQFVRIESVSCAVLR
jgi:hypothetical protein